MAARVLVAGIGNIFLGDDGFGSEVVRRLADDDVDHREDVRVVDYGIRGMHLAYDLLDGYDTLVLVDTIPADDEPGALTVLEVGPDDLGEGELDGHGMDPVAVLASLESLGGTLPPTYVVGCSPASVEECIGLTPAVAAAVDDAVGLVERLVADLRPSPATTVDKEV